MSIKKSSIIIFLFALLVFLQNPPWPIWDYYFPIMGSVVITTSFLIYDRIFLPKKFNKNLLILTFLLIIYFCVFQFFQKVSLSSLLIIVVFFQLNYISIEERYQIFNFITTIFSIIIAISLPLWLINQFLYKLPFGYEMSYGDWKGDEGVTILENYYFFIQEKHDFLNRFYSVFDEPGVLSTLASFVLFANKYNFKDKRNLIILTGAFFTYSLTFFLLTLLGLILYNIRRPIFFFRMIVIFLLIGLLIYPFIKDDPTFNTSIISRILVFESSLSERTSDNLKNYFSDYLFSFDIIFGKGTAFLASRPDLKGQGYQKFLIENGILGVTLVITMFLFLTKKKCYLTYSFLFLFIASLIQRPFLFTSWQLILFTTGAARLAYSYTHNELSN